MKNIFKWAFVALALVGVSCSKSDDNNGGSGSGSGFNSGDFTVGKHFPRKIIRTDDRIRDETSYEISNGKVVKEDNLIYEYDGNFLKSIKYNDGTVKQEFSYSNGRLIKHYFRDEGIFEYVYDN
jgi:lipoprotein